MIQYIESDIRDSDKNRVYLGGLNKLKVLHIDWAILQKIVDHFYFSAFCIWAEKYFSYE